VSGKDLADSAKLLAVMEKCEVLGPFRVTLVEFVTKAKKDVAMGGGVPYRMIGH
jgi:hypothetical protein